MKFSEWLKNIFVKNAGILLLAVGLSLVCVIAFITLLNMGA